MSFSAQVKHRPIHFYQDEAYYFITIRAIRHIHYFNSDLKKKIISNVIQKAADKFKVKIFAWVILDNHIHLLFLLSDGSTLPNFMHNINANISRMINKIDNLKGRKIFNNYWDYCIRNKKDFYLHFNYIHHNPIKHKCIGQQQKYLGQQQKCCNEQKYCNEYRFCSYRDWVEKKGEEWMSDCFATYPIRDFTIESE